MISSPSSSSSSTARSASRTMSTRTLLAVAILALSALVAADPIPATGGSLHIPLVRRQRPAGSIDWNAAADRVRMRYGYQPLNAQNRKRASSATVSILDLEGDSSYLGAIQVGTPPQTLDVILDTGSSDLFLASTDCVECSRQTIPFDSSSSSSFVGSTQALRITYGSGQVRGTLAQDTVQMGGFTVQSQTFDYVTQLTSGLLNANTSGLMGLAWTGLAASGATPFWQTLASGGAWSSPEMGFSLARFDNDNSASAIEPGGTFTLGGVDNSQFTGDVDFINLENAQNPTFWMLTVTGLNVGSSSITVPTSNGALAAIDTGTTLIGCPTSAVNDFYQQISGSQSLGSQMPGFFSIPCDTTLNTSITFSSSKSWPMSSADIILEPVDKTGTNCLGALFDLSGGESGPSIPPSNVNPSWVVGDTFLKNVYSVFRFNPPSVGFAELASGSSGAPTGGTPNSAPSSTSTSGTSTHSTSSTRTTQSSSGLGTGSGSGSSTTSSSSPPATTSPNSAKGLTLGSGFGGGHLPWTIALASLVVVCLSGAW